MSKFFFKSLSLACGNNEDVLMWSCGTLGLSVIDPAEDYILLPECCTAHELPVALFESLGVGDTPVWLRGHAFRGQDDELRLSVQHESVQATL